MKNQLKKLLKQTINEVRRAIAFFVVEKAKRAQKIKNDKKFRYSEQGRKLRK